MKKANLLLTALMALTMAGCRDVPEDVKSRYEGNSVNADADKLKENYKTSTFAEMRAALPEKIAEIKALKLDNMTFSEYLTVDIPEKMKTGNLICPTGFEKKALEIFRHYESDLNEENVVMNNRYYPTGPTYTAPDRDFRMTVGCTGFFTYYKNSEVFKEVRLNHTAHTKLIKVYTAAEAKTTKDAYKLMCSDREILVSEALEKAQAFADDFVSASDNPNGINVVKISLYESEDGERFYDILYSQSVSGVSVLEYNSRFGDTDEDITSMGTSAFMYSNELNEFVVNAYLDEYETNEEIGSAVDVVDAAKYISGTLSGYMELEVKRIAFEYYMVRGENIEEKIEGKLTHREAAPWALWCSYDLFKAVPCCVFYFDETQGREIYAILRLDDMSVTFIDNSR